MTTAELLDDVIERLSDAGLRPDLETAPDDTADMMIRLRVADRDLRIPFEVKRAVSATSASAVRAQLARHGRPGALLVTDQVSTPAAERLRGLGVQFADTAGNMYLSAPGVLIWVTGRRREGSHPGPRPPGRAFRASGLKIGLCLLAEPSLVDEPYRTIAAAADVAVGSVQAVVKDLENLGYVAVRKQRRRLVDRARLLTTWAEFYAEMLRPKLAIGRFRSQDPAWWREADAARYGVQWGGETAGALLTGHLRPETTTVYTDTLPKRLLLDERLGRDPDGNVEVRRRFWRRDLPAPRPDVVPAPLVYADLLAVGDARTAETAEMVREQFLD